MINFFDLIGRILISLVFLLSGINKIFNYEATIDWMEGFDVPGILIIPAIFLEILAPVLIIIGYYARTSSAILCVFCIITGIIFSSDFSNQMQLIGFLKNMGLAGGFLFFAINGPKKFSLENKIK